MNILILTGRFGSGHMSAAAALEQERRERYPEAAIFVVDAMRDLFPKYSDLGYQGFNFTVTHMPALYNAINEAADRFPMEGLPLKRTVIRRLELLFSIYRPDMIITVMPIWARYISAYQKQVGDTTPLFTYITDITVHEEWMAENIACYFVGAEATKNSLIMRGVDPKKIVVCGIPVRKEFLRQSEEITLPRGEKRLLIMGGGLGLIPDHLLRPLAAQRDIRITVICGSNEKLRASLEKKYPTVEAVGWTNEVHRYLKEADLVVTKAGGSTLFEAIAAETPIFALSPQLKQEKGNARFIRDHHIGIVEGVKENAARDIIRLLNSPRDLMRMKVNMHLLPASWAPKDPTGHMAHTEKTAI